MRSIPLPLQVKADKVNAELEQGILTIYIQKPKEAAPNKRSIKIKKKI
jgi:HSP20 family molecular chaperone IbpA